LPATGHRAFRAGGVEPPDLLWEIDEETALFTTSKKVVIPAKQHRT
jgi:hypothetical protein